MIVVSYDVSTRTPEGKRRLRHVARACSDYGQRVQYSVFECNVRELEWVRLRTRLLELCNADEDSLRFYFLGDDAARRTEHHGQKASIDFDGPLIA